MSAGHSEMWYEDPKIWVAAGFILFMVLFVRKLLPMITHGLDARSKRIEEQLNQAAALRAEAEAVLKDYQAKQKAFAEEADALLRQAEEEVARLKSRAEAELQETVARRKAQAEANIAQAEATAIAHVRGHMVDMATAAARQLISEHLKSGNEDPAVAKVLVELERHVH